jgi:voltage-gated potassium channel
MPATKCAPWRRKLGTFVEFDRYDRASRAYTIIITILTFVSLLPLCIKDANPLIDAIQYPIGLVFLFDYIGRWMTADIRDTDAEGTKAFLTYPFGFWAIIDLLSLISFVPFIPTALRMVRLLRLARLILIVEILRYSRGFYILYEAINREKRALLAVLLFMLVYILTIALLMFNLEPDLFHSIFDAL